VLEEWRPVKNYEGLYEVSNFGNVRSLNRVVQNGKNKNTMKGRIILQHVNPDGYLVAHLCKQSKEIVYKTHTLVWDAFGDRPRNGHKLQVDHVDNNKQNCRIDNLQLLTNRINCSKNKKSKYGTPTGVELLPSGRFSARIRIKSEQRYLGSFNTSEEASKIYQQTIYNLNEVSI